MPRGSESPPDKPKILRVEELEQAGAERIKLSTPTEEQVAWVVEKVGGVPSQMTKALQRDLEDAEYSEEEIKMMTPIQAHFIVLGGETAWQSETEGIKAPEPDFSSGRSTPQGRTIEHVGEIGIEERAAETPSIEEVADLAEKPRRKIEDTELRMAGLRRAMDSAEKEYLTAYKEFFREQRAAKRKDRKQPEDSEELQALRANFNKSRGAYGEKLEEDAGQRVLSRTMERTMMPGKKHQDVQEVMNRYNSLVRYREVVKRHAEHKRDAEYDVMSKEEKKTYEKALFWVAKQNGKLEERWGKNGARAIRASIVAVVVAGPGALAGTIGLAALGVGAWSWGKSFIGAIVGGAAAEGAAQFVDKTATGQQMKKERRIREQGRGESSEEEEIALGQQLSLAEGLEELDARQFEISKKTGALASEKRKMLTRVITGLGFGIGTAELLPTLPSVENFFDETTVRGTDATPAEARGNLESTVRQLEEETSTSNIQETSPSSPAEELRPVAEPAEAPPIAETGSAGLIDEPGEGSDRAFREIQQHLENTMSDEEIAAASPVLKHFMESDPNEISREMGDAYGTRGMITHPGDRFYFDSDQNLYYDPVNGDPQIFLENKADGSIETHAINAESLPSIDTIVPQDGALQPTEASIADSPSETVNPPSEEIGISNTLEVATTAPTETPNPSSELPQEAPTSLEGGSGIIPLEDYMSDSNTALQTPELAPHSEVENQVPSSSQEVTGIRSLEEYSRSLEEQSSSGSDSAEGPAVHPQSNAVPELPRENAVYTLRESPNALYAHATSPEQSLTLAREYGLQHPGQKIYFDNTSSWLGIKTERVGMLEFDRYGNLKDFVEKVSGQNGQTLTQIDRNLLQQRIV